MLLDFWYNPVYYGTKNSDYNGLIIYHSITAVQLFLQHWTT